jgi:RNA polymerase sigma-70 factor (TIGR02960 family)
MLSGADPMVCLARQGDRAAFDALVSPHRRELRAHCYRMLGSLQDADDALQDSLLAAWKGLPAFEGKSALRSWLYTIATHACLRLIERRPPRVLSSDMGPPFFDTAELGQPIADAAFVEPWLEATGPSDAHEDAAATLLKRESLELAFVAALQHLPGTQRAAVVLCDVLEFSATEAAESLNTTVPALNSALQRGRKSLAARAGGLSQQQERLALGQEGERALVQALVTAWERSDVAGLVSLLSEGARFTMPPLPAWFNGREWVGRFFAERVFAQPWRLKLIEPNGQFGFACYMRGPDSDVFQLAAVNVISLDAGKICWIAGFLDPGLHRALGLPASWEGDDQNLSADR